MKITRRQLKRIIKEEKAKLLKEQGRLGRREKLDDFVNMLQAAETYADSAGLETAIDQLQIIIDDFKNELERRDETDREF